MSIKNDHLYPLYLIYLENKKYSKGATELIKISEDAFLKFKIRYNNDIFFKLKQDQIYKSLNRENKIDDILI